MCIVSYEAKAWKFFIPMWYTLHKEWTQLVSYQCDKKVLQGHCPLSQYTLLNMKNTMVWLLTELLVLLPSDRAFYAPSFPSHVENLGHPRSARVTTKSKQERSRPYLENSKLSQHCYISKRWNMWMAWHSESRWFGSLRPYTVFHPIVVEFSCVLFLTQPVCMVSNQNTQNLYLQADDKRCKKWLPWYGQEIPCPHQRALVLELPERAFQCSLQALQYGVSSCRREHGMHWGPMFHMDSR